MNYHLQLFIRLIGEEIFRDGKDVVGRTVPVVMDVLLGPPKNHADKMADKRNTRVIETKGGGVIFSVFRVQ